MIAPGDNDDLSRLSKQARYERRKSEERADIGDIPAVVNPERRKRCLDSLLCFLTEYFPNTTGLTEFCDDQLEAIAVMQESSTAGGNHANAYPRGFAKTTTSQNTAIWVTFRGARKFVPVFSANDPQAEDLLTGIKTEIESNELLYEDFPEICHPIRALEGKPQRCKSQTYKGKLTHIVWKAGKIVLPTIDGSLASGAIIMSKSLTGSATRGLVHKRHDGTNQRPDWVIIDDPQTGESAANALQIKKRVDIIKRSILRSGGHRSKALSCVCNGTVIEDNDVMEILLDPKQSPGWSGRRIKMLKKYADSHATFWLGEYATLRHNWDREAPHTRAVAIKAANDFYLENRERADAGCIATWEHCYNPEQEHSAIQHAYNILIDEGPDVFATECQNEPRKDDTAKSNALTARHVSECLNGFARYQFPREVEHVVAFIDVQQSLFYYVVAAYSADFTGYVIDYGTWPEQPQRFFVLRDAQKTLQRVYPGAPLESQLFDGLTQTVNHIGDKQWLRADGAVMPLSKIIVDANWGQSTKVVKRACQVHKHANILLPWHGKGIRATQAPMGMWPKVEGERRGPSWVIRPDKEATKLRAVIGDTYYWKSFIAARFQLKAPAKQSLSLWGNDPRQHEMFANHCASEYSIRAEAQGRTVDEWFQKPNEENHWFDCLVGTAVAASICGASLESQNVGKPQRRIVSIPAHLRR